MHECGAYQTLMAGPGAWPFLHCAQLWTTGPRSGDSCLVRDVKGAC
ncbi:hypothetical protein ODI_R1885 [Orrella dioscoreae]|uniref:Uncharacterized protein n=1 Tax=Orrella dioscoreae TaxID=1851544 RepID=A0A1C3K1G9_9BURK|nr:hypothetical protein ODI_03662 [Orrella dioscoreae]SOE49169.1 hypothetical protein ODI_R1885 [Orrella dioscoreae]